MTVTALERPQILTFQQKSLAYTGFDVKWVPGSAKLVVMGQSPRNTGLIEVLELDTDGGDAGLKLIKSVEKPFGLKCATFGASSISDRNLATGDFDGRLAIWDLERMDSPIFSVKGHSGMIHGIDGVGGLTGPTTGAPEIITGSSDGQVKVWDPRQRDPVFSLSPSESSTPRECWSVAFGNAYNQEERVFAAGYETGDLKLIDLKMGKAIFETNTGNGVCSVQFDRPDIPMNKILVSGLENMVKAYDLRTINPKVGCAETNLPEKEKQLGSEKNASTIWSLRHLPQNREIFGMSSGNGLISLYKYEYPKQRSQVDDENGKIGVPGSLSFLSDGVIASQPVCAMDWHPGKLGLNATVSYDQQVRVNIITRLQSFF